MILKNGVIVIQIVILKHIFDIILKLLVRILSKNRLLILKIYLRGGKQRVCAI